MSLGPSDRGFVCVHGCVRMCVSDVSTYTLAYICTHIYMYMCFKMCVCLFVCVCVCVICYICMYIYTCMCQRRSLRQCPASTSSVKSLYCVLTYLDYGMCMLYMRVYTDISWMHR